MQDHVEDDPLDGGEGRVRAGTKHVGQHVMQLAHRERPRALLSLVHLYQIRFNHVRNACQ